MAMAKFSMGQKINHPASAAGVTPKFPAGTGAIDAVIDPAPAPNDGYTYHVRCDATGKVLPGSFKEAELSAV